MGQPCMGQCSEVFPEQRRVAVGTLRGDERVRRIDLRWGLYAYLLQDRTELVPELACGILRLPHVDNAEAAVSLSSGVSQESFNGPVRRGVDALAISELSHRLLVALPRQTCSLMNEYDRHGYLLSRVGTTRLRRPLGAINSAASVPNGKPARLGAPPEVSNLPGNPAQRASPGPVFGNDARGREAGCGRRR